MLSELANESLMNRIAMMTGAGKGIGRQMALSLAQQGIAVSCCSRNGTDLASLEKEIASFGGTAFCRELDVRNFDQLHAFAGEIKAHYGKLDFVIVNAGVDPENATIENSDVDNWTQAIETNLIGAYKTAKAAIPLLKENGFGHIIFIGSGLGHRGLPGKSAYSCSKSALWMMTRILSQELIEHNILVNEIVPGPVKTEIGRDIPQTQNTISATFNNEWNKEPKDLIPLLLFLLSQTKNGPTGQSFSLARRDIY